jgi:hypothetical protein
MLSSSLSDQKSVWCSNVPWKIGIDVDFCLRILDKGMAVWTGVHEFPHISGDRNPFGGLRPIQAWWLTGGLI